MFKVTSSPTSGAHPDRHFNALVTLDAWRPAMQVDVDFGEDCTLDDGELVPRLVVAYLVLFVVDELDRHERDG